MLVVEITILRAAGNRKLRRRELAVVMRRRTAAGVVRSTSKIVLWTTQGHGCRLCGRATYPQRVIHAVLNKPAVGVEFSRIVVFVIHVAQLKTDSLISKTENLLCKHADKR